MLKPRKKKTATPQLDAVERLVLEGLKTDDRLRQDVILEAIKFTIGLGGKERDA